MQGIELGVVHIKDHALKLQELDNNYKYKDDDFFLEKCTFFTIDVVCKNLDLGYDKSLSDVYVGGELFVVNMPYEKLVKLISENL